MLNRTIVIALLVFGAALLLVPRAEGDGNAAPARDAPADAAAPKDTSGAARTAGAGKTVLPRAADGHYYADVRVGSRTANMLVDTGASIVALTGDDARALGLSWRSADLQVIGQGAGGNVLGVPAVLPEVEVDGHRVRNVQAAIIPDGLHVSLLGQSFLGGIGRVEIENGRMVLGSS
ncbi:TIGR02281 family clan AA aspartic protease [Porphyrobacter sp. GA68]|uniref:retropepsin-like aspartic protease family protein n=1 Tax=Porphyrobacter sp. GA68 TaxID=2883480 RepID=UPI001D183C3F|nr:TIGR02281 family clan AA aspartic protease [Porphyrobacter sp. GA68]